MKIAVVGATGMVGRTMTKVLEERNSPVSQLIPVASEKSVGKEVIFKGKPVKVVSVREAVEAKPEFAIFSAGASTSKEWAPVFAKNGTVVIDNSSYWRMDKNVPLVVPEINCHVIKKGDRIIAESQLLNNTNGNGIGSSAQKIQDQSSSSGNISVGDRHRGKSCQTDGK